MHKNEHVFSEYVFISSEGVYCQWMDTGTFVMVCVCVWRGHVHSERVAHLCVC